MANLRPARANLNYSCTDVAWSWGDQDRLATAATNGAVVLWNLAAAAEGAAPSRTMEHVYSDHSRTAHKVHFSPVDRNLLASCSQVRLNSLL